MIEEWLVADRDDDTIGLSFRPVFVSSDMFFSRFGRRPRREATENRECTVQEDARYYRLCTAVSRYSCRLHSQCPYTAFPMSYTCCGLSFTCIQLNFTCLGLFLGFGLYVLLQLLSIFLLLSSVLLWLSSVLLLLSTVLYCLSSVLYFLLYTSHKQNSSYNIHFTYT